MPAVRNIFFTCQEDLAKKRDFRENDPKPYGVITHGHDDRIENRDGKDARNEKERDGLVGEERM